MPGPIPKRSEERRRRNKTPGATTVVMTGRVTVPSLPKIGSAEDIHSAARRWYNALKASGEAQFFEPSDWARAYIQAIKWSKHLRSENPSAAEYQALIKADAELLTTEAARRRARLEIDRSGDEDEEERDPAITAINDYRSRLAQ